MPSTLHPPQTRPTGGNLIGPKLIDTCDRHALEPFVWIVSELDAGRWVHRFDCGMGVGVVVDCFAQASSHATISDAVEAALDHLTAAHGWPSRW